VEITPNDFIARIAQRDLSRRPHVGVLNPTSEPRLMLKVMSHAVISARYVFMP
jgi:hypothetical protein